MASFSFVDALYISRLGTLPLAAFGFTVPVVTFYMGFIWGLMVATTSVLARAYGAGNIEAARRLATDSMMMMLLIVFAASLAGYVTIEPLFRLMGATSDVMPLIRHFMVIWYEGMAVTGVLLICVACIRADGNTHMSAMLQTMASVINLCLDPFLIYGWGPFPKMGLAGAALTLIISYAVTSLVGLHYLIIRKKLLCLPLFHAGTFDSWKKLLHVGVSSILSNLVGPISAAAVTGIAATLGHAAVAALGVSTRIEGLATIIFFAVGQGVGIFSSQNVGAGNFRRVRDMTALGIRYCLYWAVFVAALLWALAGRIPLLFDTHADVVDYTRQFLRLVPASYVALGPLIIYNTVFYSIGKPRPAIILNALRAFALYVPLAYIAEKYYGFTGILLALVMTNFIVGLLSHLWNKVTAP